MFNKILIANRGEIACRIIKTARRLGIATAAVYSEVDAHALHVELADEAFGIGPAPPGQSYLNVATIIDAALRCGAEAIHPGYGFLSENAEFARACENKGLVFIGPPVAAIEAMGSKARAKQIMEQAKVPLVPGYEGQDQSTLKLSQHAQAIAYPLLIKASAGGGGKGMRLVTAAKDFDAALVAAKREARQSFGDDHVILEKYLQHARHVEVQIFCDGKGNGVYIGDRDCSMQRRHQKIIEEAPAPGLSDGLRQQMGEAAVRAGLAIDYRGAGTVEFLLDREDNFYFMEMNTRLQVEHPVTELVSDFDLVEWQLQIAAGENLPRQQTEITLEGHAIEARLYAEDCEQGFIPSSGVVEYLQWPPVNAHLRIDSGIRQGDSISSHYDPMLAKLIVCGQDREIALGRMQAALGDCRIGGLKTNVRFLSRLVSSEALNSSNLHTAYVDEHVAKLVGEEVDWQKQLALAGIAHWLRIQNQQQFSLANTSAWQAADAWRMNLPHQQCFRFEYNDDLHEVTVCLAENFKVTVGERTWQVDAILSSDQLIASIDGHRQTFTVYFPDNQVVLFDGNYPRQFYLWTVASAVRQQQNPETSVTAPMHGRVIELAVTAGQTVAAGDPVAVVEAMKMEHTLRAAIDATVANIYYAVNDAVENGAVIVELEPST